jgi:CheY-like chemotaxis protein
MTRMLEKLATERIRVEVRCAPELWPTLADPSQVDQVVTNLVANARDAIEGPGTIRIETANATIDAPHAERTYQVAPGDYATLTVSDSGAGMDGATLRHLFEPFFTTKAAGRGTGLGLATVYGIVRQNGGGVEVRSAPGAGATFRIFLPRHRDDDREETAPTPTASAAPRGTETVLVVEDEPAVLNVVRRALEGCGYRVLTASTPGEALVVLHAEGAAIDLLVTDLAMPELSGRELAARAQAERPGLRALYLSGHPVDARSGVDVLEEGLDFLSKPFTPFVLATRVRELLDR